jgi:hypothetical protein
MAKAPIQPETAPGDAVTIVAIAVAAYALATVLHEELGHGGACLLTGGTVVSMSTVAVECSHENRLVIAAGSIMNVLTAVACFLLGRLTPPEASRLRFFFWLTVAVSLFMPAGYFVFSGIGGFGDWALFLQRLNPEWAWRVGFIIFGAVAYMAAGRFLLLELGPLIGSDKQQRFLRAARLSKISYFTGGILACLAGAFNPHGWILVVLSAAASTFGGTSGLLWTLDWGRSTGSRATTFRSVPSENLPRSAAAGFGRQSPADSGWHSSSGSAPGVRG